MRITSQDKMHHLIIEWGILPFFAHKIKGLSIEEHTPEELWFTDKQMALPWEWKGPVIGQWDCTYGKFFHKKAGFISLEWFPDFINWRRALFPLKNYCKESRHILHILQDNESMLSKELKKACGYTLSRKKNFNPYGLGNSHNNSRNGSMFDNLIAELQMGCYVIIADFEYQISRQGERYGWGIARYCTPEALFGNDIKNACKGRSPEESRQRLHTHLKTLFPHATKKQIEDLI